MPDDRTPREGRPQPSLTTLRRVEPQPSGWTSGLFRDGSLVADHHRRQVLVMRCECTGDLYYLAPGGDVIAVDRKDYPPAMPPATPPCGRWARLLRASARVPGRLLGLLGWLVRSVRRRRTGPPAPPAGGVNSHARPR
jgi:hypothetical protein